MKENPNPEEKKMKMLKILHVKDLFLTGSRQDQVAYYYRSFLH